MRPFDGVLEQREVPDLRMPLLGASAWVSGLLAHVAPWPVFAGLGTVAAVVLLGLRRRGAPRAALTGVAVVLVVAAVACSGLVRQQQVGNNPLSRLADDRAVASVTGTVTSDPRLIRGKFGDQVMLRIAARQVTGRGLTYTLRTPVLLIGSTQWRAVPLGALVRVSGRLGPADGSDLAGVLGAGRDPEILAPPGIWWRGADAVRQSLRDSVAHRPDDQRALVPALVDGDDGKLSVDLADDFRATGLTHLLAVSGTNLTLVVGFLLVLARWCGVRGRWLYVVGALGIVGFVLLARTEPSVVRAAAMGSVALLAMGANGLQRGLRALGIALVVLLLVQPELAVSVGFALSVLATAGILVLAPGWRDAMSRWLPRWLAEAIAIPASAQLACTPIVAAISGQVSVVAVAANLIVAPVVGPATVLGLAGGLVGLLWEPGGRIFGTGAGWCVAWIVVVARRGADLPTAAIDWGTGFLPLAALSLLSVGIALAGPWLLRRPSTGLGCVVLMVLAVTVRVPTPGWPTDGWLIAMCDVGQGDALVLRAGPGAGIVIDAGPEPSAVDECLQRLDVTQVPLVVLTHFHADHVDGLAGVLDARSVGAIETTRLLDPPQGVVEVAAVAKDVGLVPRPTPYGVTRTIGDVTLQALWPQPDSPSEGPGDGSTANESSVVLIAEVRGVRILLTGDVEPEGQAALARTYPGLQVDVLKVPHHGSRYQDLDFLLALNPALALVSAGSDNDYGHPSAEALDPLADAGTRVLRTDLDGDVLIVERAGALTVLTRGPAAR